MTRLKLGGIEDDKPVKLTIELPAAVHRNLVAYAEAVGREGGQAAPEPAKLIAPMIQRFMTTDRAFGKARRGSSAGQAPDRNASPSNFTSRDIRCPRTSDCLRLPAVRIRLFSDLRVSHDQCGDLQTLGVGIGAGCRGSWSFDLSVLPELRSRPTSARLLPRQIWSAPGADRFTPDRGERCIALCYC